jgi:ABC-type transport system involved in multi-copper enzyme maturation permease subunit
MSAPATTVPVDGAVQSASGGRVLPRLDSPRPTDPVGLLRLTRVEWRKQVDTRAGFWLLLSIGLVVAAVMVILLFVQGGDHAYAAYFGATATPLSILVPLVGVMAATGEWSQRTGLTTFALEPRRGRVIVAKTLAALATAVIALVVSLVLGALVHGVAVGVRGADADWSLTPGLVAGMALMLALGLLQGVGFGLSLLNTPAAIVAYLVLPTVWGVLGSLVSWLRDAARWLDIGSTSRPLLEGDMTGEQWAQLGTSSLFWVVLPLAIGAWRVLRSELK